MSAPAAFKATYSDLRFVKSRKVAQVMLELPIEQADAFVKAFGTPNPAAETWVAIARLVPEAEGKAKEPAKEKRNFSELPPSQRAALLCKTEAFWKWLSACNGVKITSDDEAAAELRFSCGVASRSALDTTQASKLVFEQMEHDYRSWLNEPL